VLRFQVSFLPCRGSTGDDVDCDFDEDATAEHRRLQRTPTPYYEDPLHSNVMSVSMWSLR